MSNEAVLENLKTVEDRYSKVYAILGGRNLEKDLVQLDWN